MNLMDIKEKAWSKVALEVLNATDLTLIRIELVFYVLANIRTFLFDEYIYEL
jgi:hypothetical protein